MMWDIYALRNLPFIGTLLREPGLVQTTRQVAKYATIPTFH
jgi:hypothetical protein